MEIPAWATQAKSVEAPVIEMGFRVDDTFYYGPDHASPAQLAALRTPLYQPIHLFHGHSLTNDVAEAPEELTKHYTEVIGLLDKHEKWSPWPSHHFWLRPIIFARETFRITFPWHDTWDQAKPLLDNLELGRQGDLFYESEQGWEVVMFLSGTRLFIRQRNPDAGEEIECVACEWKQLADQIPALRIRCRSIISRLSTQFGDDYWTSYPESMNR